MKKRMGGEAPRKGRRPRPGPGGGAGKGHAYVAIWRVVRRIPRGRVSTYGVIARLAGYPGQARLVGYALHGSPDGAGLPWQRVVNASGRISFPPGAAARRQQALLIGEGVQFEGARIPLRTFGWPARAFA